MMASEEYSCYNDTIQSLNEIKEFQLKKYGKIRILHCENLTSMDGIQDQDLLLDLNLSSNAIQRMECLHNMSQLQVLNLSCNNIRVINSLSGLFNLQKLNLSFNKISSLNNLKQLYGPDYSQFTVLDIRGNNIALVNEVKFLAGCVYLNDVAFAGTAGTNPVCGQPEYYYTVVKSLPGLKFLDQKAVQKASENVNEHLSALKPMQKSIKEDPEQPVKLGRTSRTSDEIRQENIEKQLSMQVESKIKENKKLENDLEELYSAYKELSYKFRNNEEFWTNSNKKLEDQAGKLVTVNKELDSECKRLRRKLLAKTSKITELKSRLNSVPLPNPAKEKAFDDIHLQLGNLMKDLGESQRTAQQALDEVYKKQEKLKIAEKKNFEQKAEIKRLENLIKDLHNKSIESSQQFLKRFEDLQGKYKESQASAEAKDAEIEALRQKYMEIMDLNAKFDENWSQKYREAVHSRESQISALREELSKCTLNEKSKNQDLIYNEKEENRTKIWELEQRIMNLSVEFQEKLRLNETKFTDLLRENSDLKEMLKLSVQKEAKSQDCIEELTDLIKQLQVQLDKELSDKSSNKKLSETIKQEAETEINSWKAKCESLKTRLEIIEKDVNMGEDSIHIKNREISKLKREIADKTVTIEDLEEKLKTFKSKSEKTSKGLEIEIEDLQEQVKELEQTLDTKNIIIDDQNLSIKEMKNLINQYESELEKVKKHKNSYKENYEQKLVDAYDENETLKTKLQNAENVLSEIENQVIEFQNRKNEFEEEVSELKKQINEKNEVLEYVENEISSLKKEKDLEIEEVKREKDVIISDLKRFRDELTAKLLVVDREGKGKDEKVRELESDLKVLATELRTVSGENEKMKDEIRTLLIEMDSQKKQANEKIREILKGKLKIMLDEV